MSQEVQPEHDLEPIRGSIVTLTIKLLLTLILIEGLYSAIFAVMQVGLDVPFDWHHHISLGLLIFNGVKIIFELGFILYLLMQWMGQSYFLTGKHIIKRVGILTSREEIFHFENIRSISVEQSFLGKFFNYGDITFTTSAAGGYQGDVVLSNIENPHKYEAKLKAMF